MNQNTQYVDMPAVESEDALWLRFIFTIHGPELVQRLANMGYMLRDQEEAIWALGQATRENPDFLDYLVTLDPVYEHAASVWIERNGNSAIATTNPLPPLSLLSNVNGPVPVTAPAAVPHDDILKTIKDTIHDLFTIKITPLGFVGIIVGGAVLLYFFRNHKQSA